MRRMLLSLLAVALCFPAAHAGPGHDGPVAVPGTMAIHFQEDGAIALHPSPATYAHRGKEHLACEPRTLQAAFTRSLDTWSPELARQADFDGPIDITWFFESVVPQTDTPTDWRLPLTWSLELRSGSDLEAVGDGSLLASHAGTVTPIAVDTERKVYALEGRLQWSDQPMIAPEGFQLEITLGADLPCAAMPGLRIISEDGFRPAVEWRIYDPVRIDLLKAQPMDDAIFVTLHASSPWGRDYLAIDPPQITGGDGMAHDTELIEDAIGLDAQQVWSWVAINNGTYRVDATVRASDRSAESSDLAVFKLGGTPAPVIVPPAPEKESPSFALPLLAAGLLALARRP